MEFKLDDDMELKALTEGEAVLKGELLLLFNLGDGANGCCCCC